MMSLQEYADSCIDCKKCLDVCPITIVTENENFTPQSKVRLLSRIEANECLSDEEVDNVYLSTRCGACDAVCPVNIPITSIIQRERQLLSEQGREPERTGQIVRNILEKNVPGHMDDSKRFDWVSTDLEFSEKSDVAYMAGCWTSFAHQEIARNTIRLLNVAGIKPMLLAEEKCCGLFLIDNGHLDEAASHAEKYVTYIESLGVKKLIVSCPGCYEVLKIQYPILFREATFEVILSSFLFKEMIDNGTLVPKKSEGKVALRDACPLRGEQEVFREIVSSLGFDVEELFETNMCCGAPAGVKPNYPEVSRKVAMLTIDKVKEKNVKLVSYCPFCLYHLEGTCKDCGETLEMQDITALIAEKVL